MGDVADEHDPRRSGAARRADGSWLVPGVMRPDELTEVTGLRVPVPGDEVVAGDARDRVVLRVEAMEGRRVERLSVRATPVEVES